MTETVKPPILGALAKRMPWFRGVVPTKFFERGMLKRFGI